jgi:hypothetical protein
MADGGLQFLPDIAAHTILGVGANTDEAVAVEAEWSEVLRTVPAGMLAVPSRCAARLLHLTAHDVSEIDAEVRAPVTEIGNN